MKPTPQQIFADLSLEKSSADVIVIEKALKPAIKRELVSYLTAQFAMSLSAENADNGPGWCR